MFEPYSLVLFVHVLSAIALVGHSIGAPLERAAIREAATLGDLRRWIAFAGRSGRWNPVVALVLLATGVYLGSIGWWEQAWFHVSLAGWFANVFLAGFVVKRAADATMAAALKAGEGPVPPHVDGLRRSSAWALATQSLLANDLAMLFIMMNKPGLLGSLAVAAVANAVLLAPSLLRARAGARARHPSPAGL